MDSSGTRLAVDIGPVTTVAAIDRGGHRTAVVFGDRIAMPTPKVSDEDDRDLVTALATTRSEVAEPIIAALGEHLRTVAAHTGPVDLAVLTVAPSSGPRHHEMLTRAAQLAGLTTTRVISEAAAVATHTFRDTPRDGVVLVCRLGQRSSHVTVLQRRGDGWERVATQPMPTVTGEQLDQAVAQEVIPHLPATGNLADSLQVQVGQARQHLSDGHPAALVVPGQPTPVSISPAQLQAAAQPLREQVSAAVADTLDAAGVDAHRLHGAVVYGECAEVLVPCTAAGGRLGVGAVAAEDGRLAVVYGALDSVGEPALATTGSALRVGWARHGGQLVAPVVCGLVGAALLWQTFETVARLMPREVYRTARDYEKLAVYFDTAVFAVAGWALALMCLATGRNLAAALLADPSGAHARQAGRVYAFSGVVALAVATLQGLLAQAVLGGPPGLAPPYVGAALAGAAVPALIAIILGLAAPWWRAGPSWTDRVHFPMVSVVLAGVGVMGVNVRASGLPLYGVMHTVAAVLGVAGAGLLGVAIAVTVVTQRAARFVLGTLMGAACMLIVGFANLHATVIVYLVAVGLWWFRRASRIVADNLPQRWWRRLNPADTTSSGDHLPQ